MSNKPKFRSTDIKSLITQVERKPSFYPIYKFSARTLVKRDLPGNKPQQQ